jgi:hypothetical protein
MFIEIRFLKSTYDSAGVIRDNLNSFVYKHMTSLRSMNSNINIIPKLYVLRLELNISQLISLIK